MPTPSIAVRLECPGGPCFNQSIETNEGKGWSRLDPQPILEHREMHLHSPIAIFGCRTIGHTHEDGFLAHLECSGDGENGSAEGTRQRVL